MCVRHHSGGDRSQPKRSAWIGGRCAATTKPKLDSGACRRCQLDALSTERQMPL